MKEPPPLPTFKLLPTPLKYIAIYIAVLIYDGISNNTLGKRLGNELLYIITMFSNIENVVFLRQHKIVHKIG